MGSGRHLLFTGEIGVGKSTLLRRILNEEPGTAAGFFTLWDCKKEYLYLFSYGVVPQFVPEYQVASRTEGGTHSISGRFDQLGVAALEPISPADFIVMDELGFLESREQEFQRAVLRTMDGETPVLGVIKPRHNAFLGQIRAREDVTILEVTPENRDRLFPMALQRWREKCR